MKTNILSICVVVALSFIVVACERDTSAQDTRYAVAGVDDAKAVEKFVSGLQKAVAMDDRKAVADMIHYPFATYDLGEKVKDYPAPADVIADYDVLFNQEVKDVIAAAKPETFFANQEGIMLGQGEIWFNLFDGELKINAVQNIN